MPSRTFSFWFIWIAPFVSLIFVAVGLVGFLSLYNGQRAVNDLAGQLLQRTNQLVTQHLESYLAVPKNLVRLNAAALENGTLDWQNFTALGDYFWQQAKLYHISWINLGLTDGSYVGAGYIPDTDQQMIIGERSPATDMVYYDFFTDEQGRRLRQEPDPTYDFTQEAWFIDTMQSPQLSWTDIYLWDGTYSTMSLAINQPIYQGNSQPVGAIGIDLSLDSISDFLRKLRVTPSARIFIVEKSGLVVATSGSEATFVQQDDRTERLNVIDSTDPLIKATATYLLTQIGRFDQIQTGTAFQFPWNGELEYVRVTPWHDEVGLTWWVVVMVCDSDFMAQIDANTQQTIWLSGSALLIAIMLGLFTSRLITQRVASLKLAAQQIATGQLAQPVAPSGIRELDALGDSFNSMAAQLRDSFTKLAYTASHDALTGLPNRASLQQLLAEVIARSQKECYGRVDTQTPVTPFAVLFLDLDYFKLLNDSLGHLAGDQVLIEVARRLQDCIGDRGHVARFGGDEFVILLDKLTQADDVKPIVERILSSIPKPIALADNTAFVSTSIGIVFSSHCENDAEGILRNADIALYRAKANGKAVYEIFDDEMHVEVRERLQLEMDLRRALYQEELTLYYQPIVDANSLVTVGVEALLRWRHPKQGMIPPAKFIPIAEETGLIIPLGWWVLRTACQQMQQWQQQFPQRPLVVNVNLSIRQFFHPDLLEQVRQTLAETGLPPHSLKLEITESLLVRDRPTMLARLLQLKALGVQLSLDDFGTGYSSLSYLHHFPLDTLKIDRSFVQQMLSDKQCRAVIESIVTMAHLLGMDVVAEGVETQEALAYLRDYANCEQIQGFLISPAVPAAEMHRQLCEQLAMPLYYTNRLLVPAYVDDRLATNTDR